MKNVNKNAAHMLVSYYDSYLVHHEFKNFALDGSRPFTIEVSMIYQDSNYGSFYCQDNGINIGIREARPYFTHPALGALQVPESMELERSYYHCLAVVFDGSMVRLYIHGLEIASRTVTDITPAGNGDFYIGKGFQGFIGCVRVLSTALTADEIMRDQGGNFLENPNCELWTDFSSKAYKDISKNTMDLWRTGNDVRCANVVNCTKVTGDSLFTRSNPIDYRIHFSVTGKVYPDFSRGGDFYLYCLHGDNDSYLQLYMSEKEGEYYLALAIAGETLVAGTPIKGLRWTDYAATVDMDQGTVCLYLDGAKCGEQTINGIKPFENAKAIIGGKYNIEYVGYGGAFAGLLDYCAEFDCVLSESMVDSYAEDQPYLFAEGLKALMLFGWGEPQDIYEDAPLGKYGGGCFAVVADTNSVNAPTGLNWYVPDDEDPYWNGLSAHERWEDELSRDIVCEVIESLTGIPMKGDGQAKQRSIVLKGKGNEGAVRRRSDYFHLREDSPAPGREPSPGGVALNIRGHHYAAMSRSAAMPPVTGFWASFCLFFRKYWKTILAVVAVAAIVGALAAIIIWAVNNAKKKRPKNDEAQLALESMTWNHEGDPKNGSIHFHDSVENCKSPSSMVCVPDAESVTIKGVFVPSLLQEVVVRMQVKNTGTEDYEGCITLKESTSSEVVKSEMFSLAKGASDVVELKIARETVSGTAQKSGCYEIKYTEADSKKGDVFIIRCNYTYYTLLGKPISPWNNVQGSYNPDNLGYVCTPLLDVCANVLSRKGDEGVQAVEDVQEDEDYIIKKIISDLNECGRLTYAPKGESYFSSLRLGFKYISFVKKMEGKGAVYLNCADCATIVSSLAAMHGKDYPMTILGPPHGRTHNFLCNQIQTITDKTPRWGYPFEDQGPQGGGFYFHMVNRNNERGISSNTKIYDACLKVDGGLFPGKPASDNKEKIAKQPMGMMAYGNEGPFATVPVTEAYTADVYRERLVRDGEEASFCSASYKVLGIEMEEGMSLLEAKENGFDVEQVLKGNEHVTEWELLEDMYGEAEWSFQYDTQKMEICSYRLNGRDAKEAVDMVMKQFAAPGWKDMSESYPGSTCSAMGDGCYVIWKAECVYRILGTHAKEVADCIYKA